MRSTITERGQTVIPAAIRRQFHLSPADRLEWVLDTSALLTLRDGDALLLRAAELKATFAFSLADAWIAACAQE